MKVSLRDDWKKIRRRRRISIVASATPQFSILNFQLAIPKGGGCNAISEIIVAALGLVGTLTGSMLAGKLTQYRLQALEEKVDKHNRLIERTYVLEGQMAEVQHEVREIKEKLK